MEFAISAIWVLALLGGASGVHGDEGRDRVQQLIQHADTYYWFGLAEQGNIEAFQKGITLLDEAERRLVSGTVPDSTAVASRREIAGLREDFLGQMDVSHDTLYGLFPLVRLLAPSLFVDSFATGTFELVDDPDVIAATQAAMALVQSVFGKWNTKAQLDVVFGSTPRNPSLENEVLYVFNTSSRFFVHNYREVSAALTPQHLRGFQALSPEPGAVQDLLTELGLNEVLVVTIRKLDSVDGDRLYRLDGMLYRQGQDRPIHRFFHYGFCRDRRSQLGYIVAWNLVLLAAAIATFLIHEWWRLRERFQVLPALWVVVAGFLLGRVSPWIELPVLRPFAPLPETLAVLSFWWPCLIGIALFSLPVVALRFVCLRIKSLLYDGGTAGSALEMKGRMGAVAAVIGFGVCGYLAGPAHLALQADALSLLPALLLMAAATTWILGRSLEGQGYLPEVAGVSTVILLGVLGAAYSHGVPQSMWTGAGIAVVLLAIQTSLSEKTVRPVTALAPDEAPRQSPGDLEDLLNLTIEPPYVPLGPYAEVVALSGPLVDGVNVRVALVGPGGVGKTATSLAVLRKLDSSARDEGKELTVILGCCPEPLSEEAPRPYAVFREALSGVFGTAVFGDQDRLAAKIDNMVGGLFETVVPFLGLLCPPTEAAVNAPQSREEIFASVAHAIRGLATRRHVVLLVDDCQWIDEGSLDLLRHLLVTFPAGERNGVGFVIVARDSRDLEALGLNESVVSLDSPTPADRTDILVKSLGLDLASAEAIVERIGGLGGDKGELYWLFQVIQSLARSEQLCVGSDGFELVAPIEAIEALPVREDMRSEVERRMARIPAHRTILECAACLGRRFSANVLARSLNVARLELLRDLDEIERETGFIYDVKEHDDVYEFHSPFVLDEIKKSLNIRGRGPGADDVPQIVREYHACIARSLKEELKSDSRLLFDVASHFYAAGKSHAEEGAEHCVAAARAARSSFDFAACRKFLEMGRECNEAGAGHLDIEAEEVLVACAEAHVTNEGSREAAERGLRYMAGHDREKGKVEGLRAEVAIAVCRACYEAGRSDPYFSDEAVRLGRWLVENARSATDVAEGHHFVGLASMGDALAKRQVRLETALEVLTVLPDDDLAGQALASQIKNSLAGIVAEGSQGMAEGLYRESIETKERIGDIPGLARSYNGLGRLLLSREPGDIPGARDCFQKSLAAAEKIADVKGQTMCNSSLGDCALAGIDGLQAGVERQESLGSAAQLYKTAIPFAQDLGDKLYAHAGLLESRALQGGAQALNETAENLLSLLEDADLKQGCGAGIWRLGKALEVCRGVTDATWIESLARVVESSREEG